MGYPQLAQPMFQSTPPPERGATTTRRDSPAGSFQSTPPSGERSDLAIHQLADLSGFNPRPLRREERPSASRCDKPSRRSVSIHAPLRREERRGDPLTRKLAEGSFNPRPPPERGATPSTSIAANVGSCVVSIHAPLRREERQH